MNKQNHWKALADNRNACNVSSGYYQQPRGRCNDSTLRAFLQMQKKKYNENNNQASDLKGNLLQ